MESVDLFWSDTHEQYYYVDCESGETCWACENPALAVYATSAPPPPSHNEEAETEQESYRNSCKLTINRRLRQRLVCVSSAQREPWEHESRYEINLLKHVPKKRSLETVVDIRLHRAVLPVHSMYNVHSGNNRLVVNGSLVELPIQSYDVSELCRALEFLAPLSVSYSHPTGRLTLASLSSLEFTVNFLGLGRLLGGFENGVEYASSGGVLESPGIVDLSGVKMIKLRVPELDGEFEGGVVEYIPVACSEDTLSFSTHCSPCASFLRERSLLKCTIELLDENDELVNFNGANHSLVFALTTLVYTLDGEDPVVATAEDTAS